MALIDRVKNILLTPKTEWPAIAGERPTVQSLYTGYVLLLAAIGPIALAVRAGIFGMTLGVALVSYVVALAMAYLVAWIADALAPTFGGEKDFIRSLQLTAYSYTAAWVGGIFHLVPFVGRLLAVLALIYSFYTFYLGAPILKKAAPDKAMGYTIVVVLCALVLGFVLFSVLMSFIIGGSMIRIMNPNLL